MRGYRADINLAGETDEVFSLLEEALRPLQAARQQHVAERAAYTQSRIQQQKNQRDALLHASQTGAITKPGSATASAIWLINTAAGSFLN